MRSEPTLIIEAIRLAALVAGVFGFTVTVEDQTAIAAGIVGITGLVSVLLAVWNRRRVYSRATVEQMLGAAG